MSAHRAELMGFGPTLAAQKLTERSLGMVAESALVIPCGRPTPPDRRLTSGPVGDGIQQVPRSSDASDVQDAVRTGGAGPYGRRSWGIPASLGATYRQTGRGYPAWSNIFWAALAMSWAVRPSCWRMASGVLALLGTLRTYIVPTRTPKSLAAAAAAISSPIPPM